jgi:prevent-host-death family protein
MKKIAAGQFKAQCLKLMEQVRATREPVLITKRGRPVAKLVPVAEKAPDDFIGSLEGIITIVGDIESPVVPLEDWDALR